MAEKDDFKKHILIHSPHPPLTPLLLLLRREKLFFLPVYRMEAIFLLWNTVLLEKIFSSI